MSDGSPSPSPLGNRGFHAVTVPGLYDLDDPMSLGDYEAPSIPREADGSTSTPKSSSMSSR